MFLNLTDGDTTASTIGITVKFGIAGESIDEAPEGTVPGTTRTACDVDRVTFTVQ